MIERFYIQEVISGWRLAAIFCGTYNQCIEYMNRYLAEGNYEIVPEASYTINIP